MRVLFAGSPAIAVPCLETLFRHPDIELAGVLTNPDSARGRSAHASATARACAQPTEVGEAALKLDLNLPVLKPLKLDAAAREQVSGLKCELLVSFAYGRIFGPKFLELFPLGGINIHPSLLPKYRGPTPIQAAILNRDKVTGITIQILAQEMDSGDILTAEQLQLTGGETAGSLSEIAAAKAAKMLPDVLQKIAAGTAQKIPQNHDKASYCRLLSKEDGLINWSRSAVEIEAGIRAFNPWPLCRTIHNERELIILKADVFTGEFPVDRKEEAGNCAEELPGQVLGIDKKDGILIQTGEGILAVTELQYQQKKAQMWRDFFNGARNFTGSRLG